MPASPPPGPATAPAPITKPLVLWAAAEAVPWASAGGLGDVAGALPAVLRARGWDVRLCLPYYPRLTDRPVSEPLLKLDLPGPGREEVFVRQALEPPGGVPTYLIDCPRLFARTGLYGVNGSGYHDSAYRYGIFQLAVRAWAAQLNPAPAILHCHDWHTGLLPALLQFPGQCPDPLKATRTIYTIHNLQYQGDSEASLLDALDLPQGLFHQDWAEHFGRLMPMKAGIQTADRVTTVSPTYADEIRGGDKGMGLDGVLRARGTDMRGILNGIDTVSWDPERDRSLPSAFSATAVGGRAADKAALRLELGLPGSDRDVLIGFVGRLTHEKGVDLIDHAIPALLGLGAKVAILGTGDPGLEAALARREREHPGFVRAVLRFDIHLARRMYAGVDILMVPSRTEPCGLVQLYGLRYGAVPLVHAVGGLRDTIQDAVTGFTFDHSSTSDLIAAARRAIDLWNQPADFAALQERGMREDWSWGRSAIAYDDLYQEVLRMPRREHALASAAAHPAAGVDWGPALPARMGLEALHLLVQEPGTLFCYWETDAKKALQLLLEERPSGRVYLVSSDCPTTGDYWLMAQPEAAYRAILRTSDGTVVATSNTVVTPRTSPAFDDELLPAWLKAALELDLCEDNDKGDKWHATFPESPRFDRGQRSLVELAPLLQANVHTPSTLQNDVRPSAGSSSTVQNGERS